MIIFVISALKYSCIPIEKIGVFKFSEVHSEIMQKANEKPTFLLKIGFSNKATFEFFGHVNK